MISRIAAFLRRVLSPREANRPPADPPGETPVPTTSSDTGQTYQVRAVAEVSVIADQASIAVGYNPVRPWQEKWRDALHGHSEIDRCYAGHGNNDDCRRTLTNACKAVWDVREHIMRDPAVPANVQHLVDACARLAPALSIAGAPGDKDKHHTRFPGKLTVDIEAVEFGSSGSLVRLKWTHPSGLTGTEDGRDLVQRAISEWRSFFVAYSLDESG